MLLLQMRRAPRWRETHFVEDTSRKVLVGLPYIKGLSEEPRRTFRAHRVDSFFMPSNTFHQLLCSLTFRLILCSLKDLAMEETSGVIYQINCEGIIKDSSSRSTYFGETGRTLNTS